MGLGADDAIPNQISLRNAYSAVRDWYRTHVAEVPDWDTAEAARSVLLIKALPESSGLSDLEMRAVLAEVLAGRMEWAYHRSDGAYKMAAYAEALADDDGRLVVEGELAELRRSALAPYLAHG